MVVHLFVTGLLIGSSPLVQAGQPQVSGDCLAREFGTPQQAMCLGEQEVRLAAAASKDGPERIRHLEAAVQHYRKAVDSTTDSDAKAHLLNTLADLYDAKHLDRPADMEQVLRELIPLNPLDLTPLYRLARLAEDHERFDEAASILLSAQRQQPDEVEPNRRLAQFFARRATALQQRATATEKVTAAAAPLGEPDKNGVYRVGGAVVPPRRAGNPVYPKEAQAAGIQGVVIAEILVNEAGIVTEARVVRSIPLLDEAALQAVREWRYDPTIVDGKAVPVRMTVNVSFTTAR